MNKYLIEILKIQSSVILPSFGSLMISNSKTGKIVFNPHLKFNDGALAKFISDKEGTDVQAAQNQIAKFVREIEAELGKGNSYDMFEFGSFKKDKDGNVEFAMDPKGAIINEGAPAPKTSEPAKKADDKPKTEDKPAAAPVVDKKADKAAAKAKAAEDKAAAKAKAAEDKANAKAKTIADKKAADEKVAADKAAAEKKVLDEKAAKVASAVKKEIPKIDAKPTDSEVKQDKNKFIPSSEKAASEEKKSAIERAVGDAQKAAEIKKPEIKTGSKTETPQEKNKFTPAVEKKDIGTSKAAATALAAAGKEIPAGASEKTTEVKTDSDKSMASIKDKYKKSGTSDKKQKPSAQPKKEKKKKDEGEKKKRKVWPWILLLLILGGGGTAGYLYKDKIMAMFNGTEVADNGDHEEGEGDGHGDGEAEENGHETGEGEGSGDGTGEGSSDGTGDGTEGNIEDEEEGTDQVTEEVVEEVVVEEQPVVNNTSSSGNYHVIGNAFSESGNADAYVNTMKGKGYGSAKVLGRFDGLYMVSIQQHDSRSSASSGASSAGDGAWVFKYPK